MEEVLLKKFLIYHPNIDQWLTSHKNRVFLSAIGSKIDASHAIYATNELFGNTVFEVTQVHIHIHIQYKSWAPTQTHLIFAGPLSPIPPPPRSPANNTPKKALKRSVN
jgi:hypothetical protein